jgi:hypothetical protein
MKKEASTRYLGAAGHHREEKTSKRKKEHLSLDSLSSCSFINYYYYYYYNMWARPSATPKKVGWANISPTFIFQFFLKGRV